MREAKQGNSKKKMSFDRLKADNNEEDDIEIPFAFCSRVFFFRYKTRCWVSSRASVAR
jgi:hypothetical protein